LTKFNFENETIIIKAVAKQVRIMVVFLLSIDILTPILFISGSDKLISYWLNMHWLIVGITAIFALVFYSLKRNFQNEVKENLYRQFYPNQHRLRRVLALNSRMANIEWLALQTNRL